MAADLTMRKQEDQLNELTSRCEELQKSLHDTNNFKVKLQGEYSAQFPLAIVKHLTSFLIVGW